MPRFDNEGFNPNKRINNDSRDRSVPEDENYYGSSGNDFGFGRKPVTDDVFDRQTGGDIAPPQRNYRQIQNEFNPEVLRDFDAERRRENRRIAEENRRKPAPKKQSQNRPKSKNKKRAKNLPKKIFAAVIAVILVFALCGGLLANSVLSKINYDEKVENTYVSSDRLMHSSRVKNILLLGVDARPEQDTETSRADTMMLISIDMKHKCIKMTSFLRDTWVYIPGYDSEQRLNAASTYGGYNGVVNAIEYNFGVDIDGYVVADFEMFKVLVDSVGGVEVDVTKEEAAEVTNHKTRYGNVKLKAGKHKLNGRQALAYCRIRKIDTDFVRTKRQRTVITSILKEVKKGNPLKLINMAMKCAPYIETNLSKGQLIKTAMSGLRVVKGEMLQQKVPFEGTWDYATINGASVIAINTEKNKELLIDYIYNKTAEEILAQSN